MSRSRRPAPAAVDWPALHARLARARAAAEPEASPAQTAATLAARARRLAQPPPAPPADASGLEVLTFTLGTGTYALETRVVREIARLTDMTPVPGTPPWIAGLTSLRGEMLCLVDLRSLIGVPVTPLTDLARIVVVGERTAAFGLLASQTERVEALPLPALLPLPTGNAACVRGVTAQAVVVLDGAALLASPQIIIDQRETYERRPGT